MTADLQTKQTDDRAARVPLKAGRYKLTRDVVNPAADKRTRQDWRTDRPRFLEGTQFHLRDLALALGTPALGFEVVLRNSTYSHQRLMTDRHGVESWGASDKLNELAVAIVANLEYVDSETVVETSNQKLRRERDEAFALLEKLVAEPGVLAGLATETYERIISLVGDGQS